jgi:hypothetical protein
MELLDEQFDKDIVKQDTYHYQDKIPEQLHPPMQGRLRKHDIPHQEEPRRKAHTKRDDKSGNMWFEDKETQVQVLFVQDKIITDKEGKNVQKSIRSATGSIPKSLDRHNPAERGIEKIYERNDPFFCHLCHTVKTAKITINERF